MKVSIKSFLAFAILLTIGQTVRGDYDVDAYCSIVRNGLRLASSDDCQTYYTCNNGVGTAEKCGSGLSFDKNSQTCRASSDVNCYYGIDEPCVGKSDVYVPLNTDCTGYIFCKDNKEYGRGNCPLGQYFLDGQCHYGKCTNNNDNTADNELTNVCSIMPNGIFFGSTLACDKWQLCTNGALSSDVCPTPFVFDVNNQKCNYKNPTLCTYVTGEDIQNDSTPTTKCTTTNNKAKEPNTSICSAYFVCDGSTGKWLPNSCSTGYFFSVLSNNCEVREQATTVNSCNRCEFTKKSFVNAVDPECKKYQYCENGAKKSSGACEGDSYFNENYQGCVKGTEGLKTYAGANGACYNSGGSGCQETCEALTAATCKPTTKCDCALTDGECAVCEGVIDGTTYKCDATKSCKDVCTALTATTCDQSTSLCKCGLEAGACVECPSAPNAKGECGDGTGGGEDDCKTICAEGTTADDECTKLSTTGCTCGINDGECVDCTAGKCNECICAGSDCPATGGCDKKCFEDAAGKCTYCAGGIDTTGVEPVCK